VLWISGHTADALRACHEALALARAIAHPFTEAYVHAFAARLHRDCGYVDTVRRENDALRNIAHEYRLGWWCAIAKIFDGWLAMEAGEFRPGIASIQAGLQAYQATGQDLYRTYSLSMLATAYQLCGDAAAAGAALDEAIALAEEHRQLFWHSELYRLKGELLASLNSTSAEAERCLCRAVGFGRQQGPALQLRAATSLARLWLARGKRREAQEVLGVAYWPFRTKADQSSDAAVAGTLLDQIGRERPPGKPAVRRASNASQTPRLA
jgi:predicted ATPase